MSRIFLVAKEAHFLGIGTGKAHCYLVYEKDGGERFVTSLTDGSVPRVALKASHVTRVGTMTPTDEVVLVVVRTYRGGA